MVFNGPTGTGVFSSECCEVFQVFVAEKLKAVFQKSVFVPGFFSKTAGLTEVSPWCVCVCVFKVPAGQYADHVVGLVALDADGTVVEVGLRLLVALPDGANLQLTDGLLRRVAKTTLRGTERRRGGGSTFLNLGCPLL